MAQNFLSFMQFFENLAKWYVGAPTRELAPPLTGIPESNPAFKVIGSLAFRCFIQTAILMWSTGKILQVGNG